jgi:hypothetical protein
MSEARKKAWAGVNIDIPRWVPKELIDDFIDVAKERGEEAAASHVRKLKREMVEASR